MSQPPGRQHGTKPPDDTDNGARLKVSRDALLFMLGLAGAIHELFFTSLDQPYRLAFCGGLMGLGVYWRANGRK